MKRVATAAWGLFLCAALAASPVFADLPSYDGTRPLEPVHPVEPVEIEEQLTDPTVEERHRAKSHGGAGVLRTTVEAQNSYRAAPYSRLGVARIARRDDPVGSLTHGLRAPPA